MAMCIVADAEWSQWDYLSAREQKDRQTTLTPAGAHIVVTRTSLYTSLSLKSKTATVIHRGGFVLLHSSAFQVFE